VRSFSAKAKATSVGRKKGCAIRGRGPKGGVSKAGGVLGKKSNRQTLSTEKGG